MKKHWLIFSFIYAAIWLTAHLYTLTLFPLPWFDETYMASIAKDFAENGTFRHLIAAAAHQQEEQFIYGPFYFLVVSLVIKTVGFSIFSYRLVAFIAGIGVIAIFLYLLKHLKKQPTWQLLAVVVISLDPFFWRCMHEGRMDLLALAFSLWAFYRVLQTPSRRNAVFIAFLMGLALLTTPRSWFNAPILFAIMVYRYRQNFVATILISIFVISLMYLPWVYYAFGGVGEMLNYYYDQRGYTQLDGVTVYFVKYQFPLLLVAIFVVVHQVIQRNKAYFSEIFWFCSVSIGLFYILVKDSGPYSAFIVPHYYLLIFSGVFSDIFFSKSATNRLKSAYSK
jgi:4-amino-4-deoxy-L-arabinose transferase-like glycosyltransferase